MTETLEAAGYRPRSLSREWGIGVPRAADSGACRRVMSAAG